MTLTDPDTGARTDPTSADVRPGPRWGGGVRRLGGAVRLGLLVPVLFVLGWQLLAT